MNIHQKINKTKRDVISEVIAFLIFVLLAFAFRANSYEFNNNLFRSEVESLHLKDNSVLTQYNTIRDVRGEINTYIRHRTIFDTYLDNICNNIVGNTMMRLLIANVKVRGISGVKIEVGAGDDEFDPNSNTVFINPSKYDSVSGRSLVASCGIDRSRNPVEKYRTIVDVLFHELCHAFHWNSGKLTSSNIRNTSVISSIYGMHRSGALWKWDEEVYNITGYYFGGFDPISCNMYDICKYSSNPDSIVQRIFHVSWDDHLRTMPNLLSRIEEFLINVDRYVIRIPEPILPPLQTTQPYKRKQTIPYPRTYNDHIPRNTLNPKRPPIVKPKPTFHIPIKNIPTYFNH
jgi:hypothetical protein